MNVPNLAMDPARAVSLPELLGRLRRRRVPMAVAFAAVLVLALLAALLWPARYKAAGTILIEQQEVPTELIRSTISSYADQRIQVIQQQVMTTENLLRIIQKYDLYPRQRKYQSREEVIKRMNDDVQFKMISADVIDPRTGSPTKATIAFSVGYSSSSPPLAARVANELVSLYLEQNLVSRKQHTDDAADFLNTESERLSKRIDELQGQIATFKQAHAGELPDESILNQTQLTRADDELRNIDERARSLDQQIVYLYGQLAQLSPSSQVYTSTGERVLSPADRLKFVRTEYARLSGIYSPTHPDVLRAKREMESLEQAVGGGGDANDTQRQLDDARGKLAAARQQYSDEHPDVRRLGRLVASLERQLAAPVALTGPALSAVPADNPAYIQIRAQHEAAVGERSSLATKRTELRARIAEYERHLASAPAVERDYLIMARELENDQVQYREVRQKQLAADASRNLEEQRKGERMTLIEPPVTPGEPVSPNRAVILVIGLIVAVGGAVATAAILDLLDASVRGPRDLTTLLSVPPLAVLPWIETAGDRVAAQRLRRNVVLASVAGLVLLMVAVNFLYKPLDVIWDVALRRIGN
jgi:polysaccharide biosynthesis transport protein